jgi:hypothetical protein
VIKLGHRRASSDHTTVTINNKHQERVSSALEPEESIDGLELSRMSRRDVDEAAREVLLSMIRPGLTTSAEAVRHLIARPASMGVG